MTELEEGSVAERAAKIIQGRSTHTAEVAIDLEQWQQHQGEFITAAEQEWAKICEAFQDAFAAIGLSTELPSLYQEDLEVTQERSWSYEGAKFTLGSLEHLETPNPSLRFDVLFCATITLEFDTPVEGYKASTASLWYGDLSSAGIFGWYQLEFTDSSQQLPSIEPQALSPDTVAMTGALDVGITTAEVRLVGFEPLLEDEQRHHVTTAWRDRLSEAVVGDIHRPDAKYPVNLPR